MGNLRAAWDAKGNLSQVAYTDSYTDGIARNTYALPTITTSPVPDPSGQYGSSSALLATTVYDFSTGRPASTTDANNQTTSMQYNDVLDRPTQVARAVGTGAANQATFSYDDDSRTVTTTSDLSAYGDNALVSKVLYDSLGRTVETRQYEGGTNYIAVQQQYDALGRAFKTSNPFRPWQGASPIWTTTGFDRLGRVISVTTPDNAVVSSSYSGNAVTVADQSDRKRKSVTDALGRLKEVYEDPTGVNYLTSYTYDVLDNLKTVTQGTQPARSFVYDSLKRLTSAANPESGTTSYLYDSNGNLTRKTDARGIYADYLYDALNRNTVVNYSDATLDSYRKYDLAINGKGRINQTWQAGSTISATYIDSYDALGRPLVQRQRYQTSGVWSGSFQTGRAYNLAGAVTSQTYPSGHTISYSYDAAGRASSFSGNLGDGVVRTYASAITYSPFGGLQQEQFGTQTLLFHKLHYNVRGQLYDVRLSTVAWATDQWNWNRGAIVLYYGYPHQQSGPLNNGNVSMMQHFVPANDQLTQYNYTEQRYAYNDPLNRLTSVAEYPGTQSGLGTMSFTQIYDYDRWGNRTIDPATTDGMPETQFVASSANNRLGVPAGYTGRMDYDAAGNLVNDTYTSYGRTDGVPTRLYDAENRLTTAKDGNLLVVSSYSYNADGQRTRPTVNGVQTWQVYGMDGELLGEYASGAAPFVATKEYGYRNGQLLVTVTSGDEQRLKRFVQALYYGALQRDPTSGELADKINQLAAAGAQSQAQLLVKAKEIARALFAQTNYETNAPLEKRNAVRH